MEVVEPSLYALETAVGERAGVVDGCPSMTGARERRRGRRPVSFLVHGRRWREGIEAGTGRRVRLCKRNTRRGIHLSSSSARGTSLRPQRHSTRSREPLALFHRRLGRSRLCARAIAPLCIALWAMSLARLRLLLNATSGAQSSPRGAVPLVLVARINARAWLPRHAVFIPEPPSGAAGTPSSAPRPANMRPSRAGARRDSGASTVINAVGARARELTAGSSGKSPPRRWVRR